ncbi:MULTISPECIES: hypothetical protein [unclassified Streptomyces]|uniref:hypothetical protein n=1 Tax=unclassified Streptomyces TaxID=2593676 RepID=UPI002E2E34DE|nr:hypothetical protein [Streptomyces sp. NBC_00273]
MTGSERPAAAAGDAGRGFGARRRLAPLVERSGTPAAAFLRPELELRLARHAAAGDSFARDLIARDLIARDLSVTDFGGAGHFDLVVGA